MLFANSDNDKIFPMDGNRRIIERLRHAYKLFDKPDLIDEYVSKGGHDYRPDLRVAIFKFINKHLKNESGEVKDAEFETITGKDLRVFPEDKDLPKDARNDKIDESFVAMAKVALPGPGKFDEWKKGLMKDLRDKCFRSWPERVPPATLLSKISDKDSGFPFETEPGITIRMQWEEGNPKKTNTVIALNADDPVKELPKWAEDIFEGECFLVSPRGHGLTAWTGKKPPNYVERSHALVGKTVDQMRVWDTIAIFREYRKAAPERFWQAGGRGQGGILAAYAALLEPDLVAVEIIDPPSSHRDGPFFLNVLRVLDIPDALGMLAPRHLTIHSNDKAFERTAEIYKRAGAADKFKLVPIKK